MLRTVPGIGVVLGLGEPNECWALRRGPREWLDPEG